MTLINFKPCAICGNTIKHDSREGRGKYAARKYCSRPCADKGHNLNRIKTPEQLRLFLRQKSIIDANTQCWNYQGHCFESGYPQITHNQKLTPGNRLSYIAFFGSVPDGLFVLHKCDNRRCVNPNHLFLGTNADNMADMVKKGRSCRGERVWTAKLSEKQALEILGSNKSHAELAEKYGVRVLAIYNIRTGRSWKHLAKAQHATRAEGGDGG